MPHTNGCFPRIYAAAKIKIVKTLKMKTIGFAALLVATCQAAAIEQYHGMGGSPQHFGRVQNEYNRRLGMQRDYDDFSSNKNYDLLRDRSYTQTYNNSLAGERAARVVNRFGNTFG